MWHVCTDPATRGGVSSYVAGLRATPLWDRWSVRLFVTHRDGGAWAKISAFAAGLARYCWALARRRPALVHLHMGVGASFVRKATMFWLARAAGVPAILHVHGAEFEQFHRRSPRPVRAAVRATLTAATAVVALGERWAQRLLTIAPGATVVAVPNAVRMASPAPPPGTGPVRVVFLGEIGERKGAFTLIEAWRRVAGSEGRAMALTMAGDRGVERARRAVEAAGVGGSVEVRSWLPPAEVARVLGSSHVLVLPSLHEGQPMAVLEAMAHGLCVVASDVGGIPDLVEDGRSGLLVPPGDVDALTAALRRAVTDEALRARLAAAAHARAAELFDVDVVWKRLDALYAAAVRESGWIGPRVAVKRHPSRGETTRESRSDETRVGVDGDPSRGGSAPGSGT